MNNLFCVVGGVLVMLVTSVVGLSGSWRALISSLRPALKQRMTNDGLIFVLWVTVCTSVCRLHFRLVKRWCVSVRTRVCALLLFGSCFSGSTGALVLLRVF